MPYIDIEGLLQYLKSHENVKYVNVNSTMGRHYRRHNAQPTDDLHLLSGTRNGRALVICNTYDREMWQREYKHACCVLDEQLGLEVKYNLLFFR